MANNPLVVSHTEGAAAPENTSVPVITGQTLSFSPGPGRPSFLHFNPALAAILSPRPDHTTALPLTAPQHFTFTSSQPGNFGVAVTSSPTAVPTFASFADFGPTSHVQITTETHAIQGGFPYPPGGPGDPGS